VRSWPIVGESLYRYWDLATVDLKRALVEALPYLDPVKDMGRRMATSVATGIPAFIISIVVAGFFLRPARALVDALSKAFERILPAHGHEFVVLAGSTIRNVAQGVVGVSFLQGLLAGLGFVVAGIPAAGLLAIAVFIGGILQFQALVLLPIIVWAWTAMDWQSALLFTAYIVPVGLINNVLSPMVMAHGLKVPAAVMLLGLLGGALTHGVLGLFIGPIVLAVAWELLRAWLAKDGAEALANREAVETPTRNHFNKADHAGSEAKEGVSTGLIL
jgi:predicted PurR-regulated permease PerM